jgi:hypothetical protein
VGNAINGGISPSPPLLARGFLCRGSKCLVGVSDRWNLRNGRICLGACDNSRTSDSSGQKGKTDKDILKEIARQCRILSFSSCARAWDAPQNIENGEEKRKKENSIRGIPSHRILTFHEPSAILSFAES